MMKMKGLCPLHKTALILVLVGALNWGLIGLLNFNLVMWLLGLVGAAGTWVERVVYILVGLSAVAMLGAGKCCMKACQCADDSCSHCKTEDKKPMMGADDKKPMTGGEQKM